MVKNPEIFIIHLSNLAFRGRFAEDCGGGMYNDGQEGLRQSRLVNVIFSNNTAGDRGGAMYNLSDDSGHSQPILSNVTFSDNFAENDGGAIFNNGEGEGNSSPHLTNVTFSGNSVNAFGGAVYNDSDHSGQNSPNSTNMVFSGNYAGAWGGAMFSECENKGISKPVMTNVTFSGNAAGQKGGAITAIGMVIPVPAVRMYATASCGTIRTAAVPEQSAPPFTTTTPSFLLRTAWCREPCPAGPGSAAAMGTAAETWMEIHSLLAVVNPLNAPTTAGICVCRAALPLLTQVTTRLLPAYPLTWMGERASRMGTVMVRKLWTWALRNSNPCTS